MTPTKKSKPKRALSVDNTATRLPDQLKVESLPIPRKRTSPARDHLMITDATSEEKEQIVAYCTEHRISVSEFLAQLALVDAKNADASSKEQENLNLTLTLSPAEQAKLAIFARQHQTTVEELVRGYLQTKLAKQQTPGTLETEKLSFYLSDQEHDLVKRQLKKRGLTGRTYVSFLALNAIKKPRNK
jgi:hypothetical protein